MISFLVAIEHTKDTLKIISMLCCAQQRAQHALSLTQFLRRVLYADINTESAIINA